MTHTKRNKIQRLVPIPRKGTKYVVTALNHKRLGMPLLIILRDMLKIAKNRKEVKKILLSGKVIINAKTIKRARFSVLLFDNITIKLLKKNYQLIISKNKRFELKEIDDKKINHKICKVVDKKTISNEKVQLNLNDGRNVLTDKKINTNDSVLINLKESKIEKHLPLKEDSRVFVFSGSHIGNFGKIGKIGDKKSLVKIEDKTHKEFDIQNKDLIIVENE